MTNAPPGVTDPHVVRLAALFRDHPTFREAAASLRDGASSRVRFSHVAGEWHLVRRAGVSVLSPGPCPTAPDFAIRLTPAVIDRLAAEGGGIGDYALVLFEAMLDPDPDRQVGLRVLASFARLVRNGYVALLFRAGPRVAQFLLRHGVRGATDVLRVLRRRRASDPRWDDL